MALGYVGYKYYSICAQAKTIDFQIAKAESKLAKAIELNDYKAEQLNDGFDLNYIYQYAGTVCSDGTVKSAEEALAEGVSEDQTAAEAVIKMIND